MCAPSTCHALTLPHSNIYPRTSHEQAHARMHTPSPSLCIQVRKEAWELQKSVFSHYRQDSASILRKSFWCVTGPDGRRRLPVLRATFFVCTSLYSMFLVSIRCFS